MRTLVLILMIALLPLRMWAADDMATRMAGESAIAAVAVEPMPPDCPMLAQADDEDHDQDNSSSHCVACHLCAASAIFRHPGVEQVRAAGAPPCGGSSRFASAVPHLDHKPPIS